MLMLETLCQAVATLPGELSPGPDPRGLWREKELVIGVSVSLEESHQIFEKFSHTEREFGDHKSTILVVRLKNELSETANVKTMKNKLESDNSLLGLKIDSYRKAGKEEKSKCLQQARLMADITSKSQSLEDSTKQIQQQVAATATSFKTHQKYVE
ncbi:hypothetical protein HPG69_008389 [Diceros bicornis minor]|uniref:Uncharacterized protein n=1 Tax=Diceros bicornis minor TaxID=77932 RepID=A0A7J7ENP9_DICBM|nr:hypothetical protein HPG69_008389 [Diceros bicornis minor]